MESPAMSKAPSTLSTTTNPIRSLSSETKVAESYWLRRQMSRHAEQSQSDSEENTSSSDQTALHSPRVSPKSRSLSDAAKHGLLQPSPLREFPPSTKDDIALTNSPTTPQKIPARQPSAHGLTLQLPRPAASTPGPSASISRAPLSPKLDPAQIYGSPASAIPRRSRGLDFSRACTNLHHSTLAESSPESSPSVGSRGINIPQRRVGHPTFGLPGVGPGQQSTSIPGDRTGLSSSVSSINMMESDTSSSEDDDDESMNPDRDDMMITATPQASKMAGGLANPFGAPINSPGNDWMGGYSPAAASLVSFQRARFRKSRNSRHSSSSASGNSSKPSPAPLSPPVLKSIEASNGGYFAREMSKGTVQSRRESLSLGTRDLHLSDMSDDGDSRASRGDSPAGGAADHGPRGVIRRAVTRRGNLLPKPKTFSRVRAALIEESAPLDHEAKREAEVIRQVRESDATTEATSPTYPLGKLEELTSTTSVSEGNTVSNPESSFSNQASRNSGGTKFWETFDGRYRTPPPPPGRISTQSSGVSEDTAMETPQSTIGRDIGRRSPGPHNGNPPLASEFHRKRRRDDDLDPESFKRRAVSPGMSVQSSPILTHSPIVKDANAWVVPPKSSTPLFPEQNTSNNTSGGVKRIGLQGMNETNDGLMNMSIE